MEPEEVDRYLAGLESDLQMSKYVPVESNLVSKELDSDIINAFEEERSSQYDIALRKNEIEKNKVNEAYEHLQAERDTRERISYLDIGLKDKKDIDRDFNFIEKTRKLAIETGNPFASIIPEASFFVPGSVNLFGGKTGEGKTTLAASFALSSAEAERRILYISNEESSVVHMLRVSSIACGMGFKGISGYSDEEMCQLREMGQKLRKYINFLDDESAGQSGLFTTVEGWDSFFEKLESIDSRNLYDSIVIDYYQGVFSSKKRSSIKDHEAQAIFVQRLERFREKIGIPVIIFAQLWDKKDSFQQRIKGSRSIIQRVTAAFEIIPDFQNSTSELKIHKSRICGELVGKSIIVKRSNGRFINSGFMV